MLPHGRDLTLVIDTCTERGVVAIFVGAQTLCIENLPIGLHNSSLLFPILERSLDQLKISVSDFKLIIVAVGPGSYTGIRVGVAAAKALSFASQIPLVAVSTLSAFTPDCEGEYTAIIDAKIGGAYIQNGKKTRAGITYTCEPKIVPLELLAPMLPGNAILITPSAHALMEKMGKIAPENRWQWMEKGPDAAQLMHIGSQRYIEGVFSLDGRVDILYLRKTQAEIDKEHQS